jgi:hypothetical protein
LLLLGPLRLLRFECIELDPKSAKAHYNRGTVYYLEKGDDDLAGGGAFS